MVWYNWHSKKDKIIISQRIYTLENFSENKVKSQYCIVYDAKDKKYQGKKINIQNTNSIIEQNDKIEFTTKITRRYNNVIGYEPYCIKMGIFTNDTDKITYIGKISITDNVYTQPYQCKNNVPLLLHDKKALCHPMQNHIESKLSSLS